VDVSAAWVHRCGDLRQSQIVRGHQADRAARNQSAHNCFGADLPVVTLPTGFVFGGCEQSDTGLPNGSALRVRWSFTTVGNSFQGDLTLRKVPVGANLAAAGSQVVDINGNSGTFFSVGDSFRNTTRIVWASGKYAYDLVADFHPDNPGVAPLDRNTAFAFARSVR